MSNYNTPRLLTSDIVKTMYLDKSFIANLLITQELQRIRSVTKLLNTNIIGWKLRGDLLYTLRFTKFTI